MKERISQMRENYALGKLNLEDLKADPMHQFKKWFEVASNHQGISEPNAMNLSTVGEGNKPSSRIVLLKGLEENGLIFYTNYLSRKGQEISFNQFAAITFWWPPLQQQIRIEGSIAKISPQASDRYFYSRPKGSQIGAAASPQSQIIESRATLEERVQILSDQFKEKDQIPRPNHWGGYLLSPDWFEFWQGRQNRLHDRFTYTRQADTWKIQRLAP